MESSLFIIATWVFGVLALYWLTQRFRDLSRMRTRLGTGPDAQGPQFDTRDVSEIGALERWLALAGFRGRSAAPIFILTCVVCTLLAVFSFLYLTTSGRVEDLTRHALGLPPSMADMLVPMLEVMPYLLAFILVILPWSMVRSARQKRVAEIERELPILLDLLATLSESGLGFDSALSKVVDADTDENAVQDEIRQFQLESMAGVPRTRCFRRMADRVRVGSMTIFCSAMVQAEQVGAGFSSVLRQQADDLRSRRRERALILAQSVPVKLVFPLVICFLPGIFLVTLGPAFYQFIQYADSMLSGR